MPIYPELTESSSYMGSNMFLLPGYIFLLTATDGKIVSKYKEQKVSSPYLFFS